MGLFSYFRNLKNALYYYNMARGRHLRVFMFYTTNRCNCRCLHCNIWRKEPKVDLSPDIVESVINAECTNSRFYPILFGLEGGEFLLHPKHREILEIVKDRDYLLLSNAVLDDLLIDTVREFNVQKLHISLDGCRETHARIRGIDNFRKIDHVVKELRKETTITLVYTFTPYNSYKDFMFVKNYTKQMGVNMTYSIFEDITYFDVGDAFKERANVLEGYDLKGKTDPYLLYYQDWLGGRIKVPCFSPLYRLICYPNGDVPLCHREKIILGNLYEKSLDEIWHSKRTKEIQKRFTGSCNDCWTCYHRPADLFYIRILSKGFPQFITKKLLRTRMDTKKFCE
jgi:MoaA/NifB/PqqE/SkfB family radical SAM enzyme